MALIKDIDVTNYETKSESVVITDPNGSYTLGSLIESVKMHDMFLGTGFTITQGATTYIEGRDFALTQSEEDILMTEDYGVPLYSSFKSYRLSGTVTVSYRQVATYDRAGLILRHESRLNNHDALIDAVEAVNVNQDNAISDLASDLGVHKANNVIHVSTYDRARWDGRTQTFVCDNIAARDALTGMKKGDICKVIVGANEDGKTETYIYNANAWAEITDTDLNPDVMRMTNRNAAPSATTGRLSIYAEADNLKAKTSAGSIKRFADIADGAAMTAGLPAVFQNDGSIAAGAWEGGSGGTISGGSDASKIKKIPVGYGSVAVASGVHTVHYAGGYIWRFGRDGMSASRISKHDGSEISLSISMVHDDPFVCSDGTYVWVTGSMSGYVDRISISDGSITKIPIEGGESGICSDGTYVWISQSALHKVTRITISDSSTTTVTVGTNPGSICSDGTYVWVGNYGDNSVTRITISDSSTAPINVSAAPTIVYCDSTYVWVGYAGFASVDRITKADSSVSSISVGVNASNLISDGTYVWVGNASGGVRRITVSNSTVSTIAFGANSTSYALCTDGTYVWASGGSVAVVTRVTISDSSTMAIPLAGGSIRSIANDGHALWCATNASSSNIYYTSNSPTLALSSADLGDYSNVMLVGTMYANMTLNFPSSVRCMKLINASVNSGSNNYYTLIKTASGNGVTSYCNDTLQLWCDGIDIKLGGANKNLLVGVERMTPDYEAGYPVYEKMISFGAIAQGGQANVPHGISGSFTIITQYVGCRESATVETPIPYANTSDATRNRSVFRSSSNMVIVNGSNQEAITGGYIQLKYIKAII